MRDRAPSWSGLRWAQRLGLLSALPEVVVAAAPPVAGSWSASGTAGSPVPAPARVGRPHAVCRRPSQTAEVVDPPVGPGPAATVEEAELLAALARGGLARGWCAPRRGVGEPRGRCGRRRRHTGRPVPPDPGPGVLIVARLGWHRDHRDRSHPPRRRPHPEVAQEIAELDGVTEVYSVAGDVDLVATSGSTSTTPSPTSSPTGSARSPASGARRRISPSVPTHGTTSRPPSASAGLTSRPPSASDWTDLRAVPEPTSEPSPRWPAGRPRLTCGADLAGARVEWRARSHCWRAWQGRSHRRRLAATHRSSAAAADPSSSAAAARAIPALTSRCRDSVSRPSPQR